VSSRAAIQIRVVKIPSRMEGKMAHLGVGPVDYRETSEAEHDRIAREASEAGVLIRPRRATPVQWALLERLANASPDRKLKFPFVGTLKRFLLATKPLDAAAADSLSDEELLALWERADPSRR
jgi:hypothetical protein